MKHNREKHTMRKIIGLIGATLTAVALLHSSSNATAVPANDCDRVTVADRKLCKSVQGQHSYGAYYFNDFDATWSTPNGRVLVREITHDGLTKAEMHAALVAYAAEYREYVTHVTVNMDAMVKKCGNTDGQWVTSYVDEDGRDGGTKLTYRRIVCA